MSKSSSNSLQQTMEHLIHPGFQLQNKCYTIEKQLGSGGFGITYKATYEKEISIKERFQNISSKITMPVAIKELFIEGKCLRNTENSSVILQSLSEENFTDFKQKFLHEAETLAAFNKVPHVAHVIDFFEENNTAYMVMEYIEGQTLSQLVDEKGPLDEHLTLKYAKQISQDLQIIHQENIIHRDIKPDNIIITPNDEPVLIDFGAAREFVTNKNITNSVILTHGYAPIEQYSEKRIRGPFTDVYALGATMVFCLTGERPLSVHDREPNDLILEGNEYSKKTQNIINKAMAHSGEDRYQNCKELFTALSDSDEDPTVAYSPEDHEIKTISEGTIGKTDPEKTTFIEREPIKVTSSKRKYLISLLIIIAVAIGGFYLLKNYQINSLIKNARQSYFENDMQKAFEGFEEASKTGSPLAQYYVSKLHYKGWGTPRDPEKGKYFANEALDQGYNLAAFNLGLAHINGWGVEMDTNQANLYFAESKQVILEESNKGNPEAQYLMGHLFYWGWATDKSDSEAFNWFKRSAAQGHPEAQSATAFMFYYGKGTEQDHVKALEWYRKGEKYEDGGSLNGLGRHYYYGQEVEQDYQASFNYFKKAATSNNPDSKGMANLALMYYSGVGSVDKDWQKAFEWYQEAADLGGPEGMVGVAGMYHRGEYVGKNTLKASEWYEKAAYLRNTTAMTNLGWMYENGDLKQDYDKSVYWYKKASRAGSAIATYNLAHMYNQSKYGMQNFEKAYELYSQAADSGHANAMNSRGVCYENGQGVAKDLDKAFEWYTKGAQAGASYAMYNLGRHYHYGINNRKVDLNKALDWYTQAEKAGHPTAKSMKNTVKTKINSGLSSPGNAKNSSPRKNAGSSYSINALYKTNYYLNKGDSFSVSASGKISFGIFAGSGGPNGISGFSTYSVHPSFNHGSLLLTIGDSNGWTYVGYGDNFKANTSGYLTFMVNDRDLANNSGRFNVVVKPGN